MSRYDRLAHTEWLETNGTGGFAMGTAAGTHTRRYHGLLVAALKPPVERHVLLSRLDETVLPDQPLATNQYPGALSPQGWQRLVEFRREPFPTWIFELDGKRLQKTLFLVPGEQTVVVRYRSSHALRLSIEPFLAFRDYHALQKSNDVLNPAVRQQGATLFVKPYAALPELALHFSKGAQFTANGCWYANTEYLVEMERGLDFHEDLWKLGTVELGVGPEAPAFAVATLTDRSFDAAAVEALEKEVRKRRQGSRLENAAEQFVVKRADGKPTIIAGYPWFTDWGRDTMISLPGLLLARGRHDEAREVLRGFLAHLNQGLIPNRFPDFGPPQYNTVDATLWLFQAAHAVLQARDDEAFLRDELYPAACQILVWHQRGTLHGIQADPKDGLLMHGPQLTWMDAAGFTPRAGKAVEINALWINALRLAAQWGQRLGQANDFGARADRAEASFGPAFWNEQRGCLYDVAEPQDGSLRPNQLFAVCLPFPLLNDPQRRSLVRTVEQTLLTPFGLRTLAKGDNGYTPHYRGNVAQRDGAYHMGTVWPWLLGPYIRAYLTAFGRDEATLRTCRELLLPLEELLAQDGTLPEVFDAEEPHQPGGAPAQAWSVAELQQLLSELGTPQRRPEARL